MTNRAVARVVALSYECAIDAALSYDARHMPCDHVGGPEVIEMAVAYLREGGIHPSQWRGMRFRWSENPNAGMWASIVIEIERRGDEWVVVRLDRNRERVVETGFRRIA
jgi:hypothetical protein